MNINSLKIGHTPNPSREGEAQFATFLNAMYNLERSASDFHS